MIGVARLGEVREAGASHLNLLFRCCDDSDFNVRISSALALFHITHDTEYLVRSARDELVRVRDAESLKAAMRWVYNVPEAHWAASLLQSLSFAADHTVSAKALEYLAFFSPDTSFVHERCVATQSSYAAQHVYNYYHAMKLDGPDWIEPKKLSKLFPYIERLHSGSNKFKEVTVPSFARTTTAFHEARNFCESLAQVEEIPSSILPVLKTVISWDWSSRGAEEDDEKRLYFIPAVLSRFGSEAADAIPDLLRFAKTSRDPWARSFAWKAIARICPDFPSPFTVGSQGQDFVAQIIDEWTRCGILKPLERQDVHESPAVSPSQRILATIKEVQSPIVSQVNAWLQSLEGKTFSPEEASGIVAEIRHVVASAGCQLVFEGQPVSLSISTAPRSKAASIYVFTIGEGRAEKALREICVPAVHRDSDLSINFSGKSLTTERVGNKLPTVREEKPVTDRASPCRPPAP